MEHQTQGTCSFCRIERDSIVRADLTGKAVCEECLFVCTEQAQMRPPGAICCLKCYSIDGFKVRYAQGEATFTFFGLDLHRTVMYGVSSSTFPWRTGLYPIALRCLKCKAGIPLWQLPRSRYVQQVHTT